MMLITISVIYGAVVFGPVSYYRTTGAPDVYDTTFTAYDTTVACTLVIINGDDTGEHRLSAASIEFNDEEIIVERDFNETVETIVRVVTLQSENDLHLRLRSGPGDYLTMNVHRPCDAFVELTIDTVIDGEARFTTTAGGWGDITYSWDFEGDGVYDTTTTDSEVSHIYEESDTYLVKVKVEDLACCIAEDSIEVIIELGYHYTFEIDSSYTPWSWTFPPSDSLLVFDLVSDNGATVIIKSYTDRSGKIKKFHVLNGGELTSTIERIYSISLNHSGDRIIVVEDTLSYTIDTTIGGIDTIPFQLDLQDVFRFHAGVAGRIGMQKRYIGVD